MGGSFRSSSRGRTRIVDPGVASGLLFKVNVTCSTFEMGATSVLLPVAPGLKKKQLHIQLIIPLLVKKTLLIISQFEIKIN